MLCNHFILRLFGKGGAGGEGVINFVFVCVRGYDNGIIDRQDMGGIT